ncbi:Aste57867_18296 [Aphanomyces stellatus]|uniref:Aste57867_18296 protein n=1 Tax=Aphanomyces stellatus TaxID=120398 RepID=A0A485LAK9_9STRA|nr:hypothetical protein As57867_018234 [Aphanomyces stellatus]VFT95033.1 Aste57867_18296 [Aphanomyces stellatus]
MLSLNTYGLAKSSNQLTLPRLVPHPPIRDSNSYSVGKLAQERRDVHPWYRTTSGFQHGRHVDFQDLGLNLSPLKAHCRHMAFTNEFLEGPFTDSSLGSLETKKKRLVLSDRLRAERKIRMKQKFDEKQLQLSFKREIRRELREKRRLELGEQSQASVVIQARARGMITRGRLHAARRATEQVNAVKIQTFFRSQMRVRAAKRELQKIKDDIRADAACIIQRQIRRHLAKKRARAELRRRRELRTHRRAQILREAEEARKRAAVHMQRLGRGYLVRKKMAARRLVVDVALPMASQPNAKRKTQPQPPSKAKTSAPPPTKLNKKKRQEGGLGSRRMSSMDVNGMLNDA